MANSSSVKEVSVIKRKHSVTPRSTQHASSASALPFSINSILGLEETPSTPLLSGSGPSASPSAADKSLTPNSLGSPTSPNDENSEEERREAKEPEELPRKRRSRTTFRADQVQQLKRAFAYSSYLSYAMEDELSERLGLKNRQIRTWFQNRRGKQKRGLDQSDQFANELSRISEQEAEGYPKPVGPVLQNQLVPQHYPSMMQPAPCYPDDRRRHLVHRSCHEVCSCQSAPLRLPGFYRYQPYRCPAVHQGLSQTASRRSARKHPWSYV